MKLLKTALVSLALVGAPLVATSAFAADSCGPSFCSYADPGIKQLVAQLGLTLSSIPLTGGIQITLIDDPNGAGASNGLQVGDQIVSANSVGVSTLQQLINVIAIARGVIGINHGVVNLAVRDVNFPHDIVNLAVIIP